VPRRMRPSEIALLHEVLDRWLPPERQDLRERAEQDALSPIERREVSELITKELLATGLAASDEPTQGDCVLRP
jgi:hypothetical protein